MHDTECPYCDLVPYSNILILKKVIDLERWKQLNYIVYDLCITYKIRNQKSYMKSSSFRGFHATHI